MPKKKGKKKITPQDFTINDSANAAKPVTRLKKAASSEAATSELSWDQIEGDDFDIVEEVDSDGTKSFVLKKKRNQPKSEHDEIDNRPGIVYPEIVWYLISPFIKPEDIINFAGINKDAYAVTKRESFWRSLYKKYCQNNPNLPRRLWLENSYKSYGLRQRVIRSLYCTYDVFIKKVQQQALHDSKPHQLVKRRCVNVWFCKGAAHWLIYFKLKKLSLERPSDVGLGLLEELERIDANPEEDSQVLQVTCESFYEVPPLMGMTLSSVSVVLSQGFRHHRLHLGFNRGCHNVSRNILPECTVVLDTVVKILVIDWWHPKYPHFDNRLPLNVIGDESLPVLKKDFFSMCDGEL